MKKLFIPLLILIGCAQETPKSRVYFDVPSLLGKNIDETRRILDFEEQVDPVDDSITHWEDLYEINKHILLINYNPQTRKIDDISVIYPDGYPTKQEMLQIGNLNGDISNRCEIDSVRFSFSSETRYNSVKVR